jgi:integrase
MSATCSRFSAGSTSDPPIGDASGSSDRPSRPSSSGVSSLPMRGHNEGSIYRRRHDKRWMAALTLPSGKRAQKLAPKNKNTHAGAKDALNDLIVARDRVVDPTADSRLGPFLQRWLDEARPGLRPSTFRTYRMIVELHLVPELGGYRVGELTVPTVQAYLRRMGETLSPQSVAHHRAVLRRALNVAVRWRILERNVAALAEGPHVERRELAVLSADQVRQLLQATEGDRLHPLWAVAATTGMRQAEVLGITWREVDFKEKHELRVERTLSRSGGKWVMVEPKTKRSRRTIPLTPMAVAALRSWRGRQHEERLAGGIGGEYEGLVFTTPAGMPLQGSEVTKALQRALEAARLPRIRFQDLRHGAATILLSAGFTLEDVKNLLGHSTIALTSNTYGHYEERRGRELAAGMDKAIGGAG